VADRQLLKGKFVKKFYYTQAHADDRKYLVAGEAQLARYELTSRRRAVADVRRIPLSPSLPGRATPVRHFTASLRRTVPDK